MKIKIFSIRLISLLLVVGCIYLTYYIFINLGSLKLLGLSVYAWLNAQNPMIAGAISLWALGSLTYLSRSIPQKVWSIILKQSTVTLTMNNEDTIYNDFLIWYHKTGKSQKSRTLVAKNFWNDLDDEQLNISAGYGTHYFTFGSKIFKFSRDLKESTQSREVKESLTLTTIGRSQKQFHNIIEAIISKETDKDITSIYRWETNYWNSYSQQSVRKFDSVILPEKTKTTIVSHIDNFLSNRSWYLDHGIPYRTGLILYGVPGTGKTSLVRALCEKFNKPLYMLSLSGMTDKSLELALSSLPKDSLLLIEDVDTYSVTSRRVEEEKGDSDISFLTLSGLLNAIDGIVSSDGRILIATTNHIEKLDEALVRKGRFNLNVEIGYLTAECFKEFFKQFYPTFVISDVKFKQEISPADLQALIMDNLDNPQLVLKECVE